MGLIHLRRLSLLRVDLFDSCLLQSFSFILSFFYPFLQQRRWISFLFLAAQDDFLLFHFLLQHKMIDFLSSFIYFGYLFLTSYAFSVMTAAVISPADAPTFSLPSSLPPWTVDGAPLESARRSAAHVTTQSWRLHRPCVLRPSGSSWATRGRASRPSQRYTARSSNRSGC